MHHPQLFHVEQLSTVTVLRLISSDGTNRLTRERVVALTECIQQLARHPRPLVITGNETFFSAGAELAEIVALRGAEAYEFSKMGQQLMNMVDGFPATVIAAVNGYCMGGGFEMALNCDILIAAESAQFALPEITLGFFPGAGGPVRLPRSIPRAFANDILFTGERFSAESALRYGIVSRVVAGGQLMATANAMAKRIAGFAPLAVRAMLELIHRQDDLPLSDALRLASTMRWTIGQTEDAKEGPRAFAEKRAPKFMGR